MVVPKKVTSMVLALYLLTLLFTGFFSWGTSYQSLVNQAQGDAKQLKSYLVSQLDKFAHLPRLLAKDRAIINALLSPENTAQIDITNRYLAEVNQILEASDIYLLDHTGFTLAASNWALEKSFIGRNYSFRPYFKEAIRGNAGEYFALGSASGQRGYYYSYPIEYGANRLGVVVVKKNLANIEQSWVNKTSEFVVTDSDNVIFMSSQPAWLFHSLLDLSQSRLEQISQGQRYLGKEIESLGFHGDINQNVGMIQPADSSLNRQAYITVSEPMEITQLTVRVLSPKREHLLDVAASLAIVTLVFTVFYLALLVYSQQKYKQRQIEKIQNEAKQKLEFLVMERTAELHTEIKVRTDTERALRQTQAELIQAAKLAVLGQMSAGISHELNNPLAAIRSYADNARKFLQKDKLESADSNLERISSLTERMAKISQQLKAFAKKTSSEELVDTQIYPLAIAAKELMKSQYKSHAVSLELTCEQTDLHTQINPIQLEQVLVNLLTNAMHALEGRESKQVLVNIYQAEEQIVIEISDNGPGISQDHLAHLFEPFFTTKTNGLGLGLSISQQIIEAMMGSLTADNKIEGGACFAIRLPMPSNNSQLSK
ncbi:ATP-binding protein [Vibrio sp. SCSIO 43136]|uniref:sensor histidine kinase n=1 Tax=Vibrio sp. SCSIO 43136 TaxID=2819101 RepID=UPI002075B7DD|nr:ATP-binding protein [Vibrio sp. SCSIO 43136]USD64478.1 sensor histidine kinase [Vibrio sp. SCSIO 43136]